MIESQKPVGFTVTARTILELGAELISSDAIALYELVKNSYDADSKRVEIEITNVFSHSAMRNTAARIQAAQNRVKIDPAREPALLAKMITEIGETVDRTAPPKALAAFLDGIGAATDLESLIIALDQAYERANMISIIDTGEGMSLKDLREVFLTIGTRSRLKDQGRRHYVGGKGIGRLSTMRLADRLTLTTTTAGALDLYELDIDWRRFSHASAEMLDKIPISPRVRSRKDKPSEKGTRIDLRILKADWDIERVRRLANAQLDRLFDPFADKARYPILLKVNGTPVLIPTFDKRLLTEAQAQGDIRYFAAGPDGPRLVFTINYLAYGRTKTIEYDQTDMLGITSAEDVSLAAMGSIGDFTARFYWFNRQKLAKLDGVGTRTQVRDLVNHWANGLLMYRDGFRVNPYGAPNDDWLGVDVKALGSAGYIGAVCRRFAIL